MTAGGDMALQMPKHCQVGRSLLGPPDWDEWVNPCEQAATMYMVSDEAELPEGFTTTYDVHVALELWTCGTHMHHLLIMTGWSSLYPVGWEIE